MMRCQPFKKPMKEHPLIQVGWLFYQLEKVPQISDQVSFGEWVYTVQEMDELRISRILVKKNSILVPITEANES